MITGKIKGGLGNQLFQYAFLKGLSYRLNEPNHFCLDTAIYKKKNNRSLEIKDFKIVDNNEKEEDIRKRMAHAFEFGTSAYKIATVIDSITDFGYFFEKDRKYIRFEKLCRYNYFDGYWQSEKYFNFIREQILADLELKLEINYDQYIIESHNSCAIGFRRGDYFKNKKSLKIYDVCNELYYENAIRYMNDKYSDVIFYVFSDDVRWVKENFNFKNNKVKYINENKELSPAAELKIMSKCKHAIIPNSTFSWWGAWLIEGEEKKIICPKGWYANGMPNDIIPESWIQIDKKGNIL
jgi:hypothetical protein